MESVTEGEHKGLPEEIKGERKRESDIGRRFRRLAKNRNKLFMIEPTATEIRRHDSRLKEFWQGEKNN